MKGTSSLFSPKISVASGDILFPSGNELFFENVSKRQDVDPNGCDVSNDAEPEYMITLEEYQ